MAQNSSEQGTRGVGPDAPTIAGWLRARLIREPGLRFEPRAAFSEMGLGSLQVVRVAHDLAEWLDDQSVSPSLFYACPTVDSLSTFLAGERRHAAPNASASRIAEFGFEPVAIVGMACRFPGAPNLRSYWRLLSEGRHAIVEVPSERWSAEDFYDPDPGARGRSVSRWGGFISNADHFDAAFFGLPPREAACMDPQHRLLLEVAWSALADAGVPPRALLGTDAGVFIGLASRDYEQLLGNPDDVDAYWSTGNASSIAANRISYLLDARGPSMTVDTACSSSLVALHLACRALGSGECSVALVGGANLMLTPTITLSFSRGGALSPDGRCFAFDARANGMVRGEGVGVVVLRPLSAALEAGDRVYAVVRGTAINQDGRSNGITAPNELAQREVIRAAHRVAGAHPAEIGYVETHGTGTLLGDVVEAKALGAVLSEGTSERGSACWVGSVKTNLGHLEAAAGIASLIKTSLVVHHGVIPPSLNYEAPNPMIPFEDLGLRVVTRSIPLQRSSSGGLAGVSSFGFGGTNAHVVLAPPPERAQAKGAATPEGTSVHVLAISARSEAALERLAVDYQAHLREVPEEESVGPTSFARFVGAAAHRRPHFDHRIAVVANTASQAHERLERLLRRGRCLGAERGHRAGDPPALVYVFSGQGPKWVPANAELFRVPEFAATIDRCAQLLSELGATWSLREAILEENGDQLEQSQCALFAIQVGLAALFRRWGLGASAVLGHSLGEVAAAHVAGVLSLPDALRVVRERGRLMQELRASLEDPGGMLLVQLSREDALIEVAASHGRAEVAVQNTKTAVVLAGDASFLADLQRRLEGRGVKCRPLHVAGAGHSRRVEPIRAALSSALGGISPRARVIPFFSSVLGREMGDEEDVGPEYWARNVRDPVNFSDALGELTRSLGRSSLLELSAAPALVEMIQESLGASHAVVPSLRRQRRPDESLRHSIASLYVAGHDPDWSRIESTVGSAELPDLPWERSRHWVGTTASRRAGSGVSSKDAEPLAQGPGLIGAPMADPGNPRQRTWQAELGLTSSQAYLRDHRVDGQTLLPGTAFVEMALEAMRQVAVPGPCARITSMSFRRAVFLRDDRSERVSVSLSPGGFGDSRFRFSVWSRPDGAAPAEAWRLSAEATLERIAEGGTLCEKPAVASLDPPWSAIRARCSRAVSPAEHYARSRRAGVQYGPAFQGIEILYAGEREAVAFVRAPDVLGDTPTSYEVHPAVLDACLQALIATVPEPAIGNGEARYLPVGFREATFYARPGASSTLVSAVERRDEASPGPGGTLEGDITIWDETGIRVAEIRGFRVQALGKAETESAEGWLYELAWERLPETDSGALSNDGSWLLVGDRSTASLRQALGRQLASLNIEARLAEPDEAIRSLSGADARAAAAAKPLSEVCLFAGIEAEEADTDRDPERFSERVDATLIEALALVAALARYSLLRSPAIAQAWLITTGSQDVSQAPTDAGGRTSLRHAPLWGLARTVAAEEGRLWGGVVDLDPSHPAERSVAQLVRHVRTASRGDGENQIAFRGDARFVARLDRLRRPLGIPIPIQFRANGAYLVTGAFGGLGRRVARWLVEHGARSLILVGRSRLPARSEWAALESDSPDAERAGLVRELESIGARIHVAPLDVAEPAALRSYLDDYRRDCWPPIRGVMHAAGSVDLAAARDLVPAQVRAVTRAKIAGTLALDDALSDDSLDFFVLFSSFSAVLGSPGLSHYAAANSFLDAFARHRRASGKRGISVNWGAWADAGMVQGHANSDRISVRGLAAFSPDTALDLLARFLSEDRTDIGVMRVDWEEWQRSYPQFAQQSSLRRLLVSRPSTETPARALRASVLALPPNDRPPFVLAALAEIVSHTLGLPPGDLDMQQPISALGLDSLMSVELKKQIERDFGVVLPTLDILRGPTVATLAETVANLVEPSDRGAASTSAERRPTDHAHIGESPASFSTLEGSAAAEARARLDGLSDDEVDKMLRTLL